MRENPKGFGSVRTGAAAEAHGAGDAVIARGMDAAIHDGLPDWRADLIRDGARLAPELPARLRTEFGCTPQEVNGTAEGLINMVRLDADDDLLLESSGAPGCELDEIRVVDDAGNEVADGEPNNAGTFT